MTVKQTSLDFRLKIKPVKNQYVNGMFDDHK